MANDVSLHHVDHVHGDIGGVIGDPFQVPRNAEQADVEVEVFWLRGDLCTD